jgi:hypothetical protein
VNRENLRTQSDAALAAVVVTENHMARRHNTIEDVEESERLVEEAKDLLAARHAIGTCGREKLPDQG